MAASTTSIHSKAESSGLLVKSFIKIVLKFGLVLFFMTILLGGNPLVDKIKNISS